MEVLDEAKEAAQQMVQKRALQLGGGNSAAGNRQPELPVTVEAVVPYRGAQFFCPMQWLEARGISHVKRTAVSL